MQLTSDRPQIEEVEDLPCAETPADFLLRSMDTHFANFEKTQKTGEIVLQSASQL